MRKNQKQEWSISIKRESIVLKRHGGWLFDSLFTFIPLFLLATIVFFAVLLISSIDYSRIDNGIWIAFIFIIVSIFFVLFIIYAVWKSGKLFLRYIEINKDNEITILKYLFGLKVKINEKPDHIKFSYSATGETPSEMSANLIFKKNKHKIITLFRVTGTKEFSLEKSIMLGKPFLETLNIPYKSDSLN